MKTAQIKQMLKKSVDENTPNVLEKVLETPINKQSVTYEVKKNKSYVKKTLATITTCAAMFVFAIVGFGMMNNKVDSIITLDVNPSFQLALNEKEMVVNCEPKNEDAKRVLGDMKLEKLDAQTAVNALIGAMFKEGYLGTDSKDNGVLLTVLNKNNEKSTKIEQQLKESIKVVLQENDAKGVVITQKDVANEETKKQADQHNVSIGKMIFIEKLMKKDGSLDFNQLLTMPIKDIARLIQNNKIDVSDIVEKDEDDTLDELIDEAIDDANEANGIDDDDDKDDVDDDKNDKDDDKDDDDDDKNDKDDDKDDVDDDKNDKDDDKDDVNDDSDDKDDNDGTDEKDDDTDDNADDDDDTDDGKKEVDDDDNNEVEDND